MPNFVLLGKFTPIGMRAKVDDPTGLVISTCGANDTAEIGTETSWSWCNPTNRVIVHPYEDVEAVSVETLWQSCKLMNGQTRPDDEILNGNWRKNKGRRPVGAYAGPGKPLITSPGEARRRIYVPAFKRLIEYWLQDERVMIRLQKARDHNGNVYLRDHDVGRGIDRNAPMSHAWVFAVFLNTGEFPG